MNNNPFDYFRQLEQIGEQMRRVFGDGDFMKNFMPNMAGAKPGAPAPDSPTAGQWNWMGHPQHPPVDLYQTQMELIAVVEVPGLENKGDLSLSVEPDRLIIKSFHSGRYPNIPKDQFLLSERQLGPFEREVSLPVRVIAKEAKAFYRNGLLEIHMRKDQRLDDRTGHTIPINF